MVKLQLYETVLKLELSAQTNSISTTEGNIKQCFF